jgi:hypothetical protein
MAGPFRITPYPYSRFWALYEGDELLGVTVYKKGAERLAERFKELAPDAVIEESREMLGVTSKLG